MIYLGIDIGFSATVRSTGICVLTPQDADPVVCRHVKTSETIATIEKLLAGRKPSVISIDGPLVPGVGKQAFRIINRYRECERLLSGGIFQKRCKSGPTNSPRGQALHRQATLIARFLSKNYPCVPIFEAFPNAFLGIMMPDSVFSKPIRRGIKSDVFWSFAVHRSNLMKLLLRDLFAKHRHERLHRVCHNLDNHDERAAFVCAVTARAAQLNRSIMIRTKNDGAIALSPRNLTQDWASSILKARLTGTNA